MVEIAEDLRQARVVTLENPNTWRDRAEQLANMRQRLMDIEGAQARRLVVREGIETLSEAAKPVDLFADQRRELRLVLCRVTANELSSGAYSGERITDLMRKGSHGAGARGFIPTRGGSAPQDHHNMFGVAKRCRGDANRHVRRGGQNGVAFDNAGAATNALKKISEQRLVPEEIGDGWAGTGAAQTRCQVFGGTVGEANATDTVHADHSLGQCIQPFRRARRRVGSTMPGWRDMRRGLGAHGDSMAPKKRAPSVYAATQQERARSVTWGAIIVAAGRGERHGGGEPKQYQRLHGAPVLRWSVESFCRAGAADVVVAVDQSYQGPAHAGLAGTSARLVIGGATRTASVRAALAQLRDVDVVMIHDGARPGLSVALIERLLHAIDAGVPAVAPALPVTDALARSDGEPVGRDGLLRVQTPQAFAADVLRSAYARASPDISFADDLAVVRAAGTPVRFIDGDPRLMKITYPGDLDMAARLMGERIVCVGNGVDAHRFGPGDYVTLCGVRIPHERGLVGHSDADAAWHALVDAMLGAMGQGDIGAHFPPNDPRWKGADSESFLRHAVQLLERTGTRLMHVDITLMCERPRVGPHREAMRARTAEVLGLPLSFVSVKATTTEKMGFLGREEGLAALATATVSRFESD